MSRLAITVLLALCAAAACFAGGDASPPSTPTSTPEPALTATARRATATPAEDASPSPVATAQSTPRVGAELQVITGRHFRATVPWSWLYMDAQGPVPEATMTRIERLPRLARAWVLEAREDLDLEVIFTGLPEDRAGQIRVLADCDRGWDRGPGDWDWLVLLTYRDTERPFREGGRDRGDRGTSVPGLHTERGGG